MDKFSLVVLSENLMSHADYSRRKLLRHLTSSGLVFAAPATLTGLSGCAADVSSSRSYVNELAAKREATAVMRWTDVMLQMVRDRSIPPPAATRAFALGHLAGFLAVNGLRPRYQTPYAIGPEPTGADAEIAYGIALATASARGLGASLALDERLFLARYPSSDAKSEAVRWGRRVGRYISNLRASDGAHVAGFIRDTETYPERKDLLAWSETRKRFGAKNPPVFGPIEEPLLPGWGKIKPWVIGSVNNHVTQDFPDVGSDEFVRQFIKIRDLGGVDSRIRTEDQSQIAFFWEDGPKGVTPPGHWQIIALDLMGRAPLDLLDQARFMALISLAQADAAIVTWHSKFQHDIIRPETAVGTVRHGFGNPALTNAHVPGWVTLIPTPPFPAYISGHSTFSAASARMLVNLLGRDDISFSGKAPDLVNWPTQLRGVKRHWNSIWSAAEEGGASREYGGIHWEADNTEGLRIGRNIADDVYRNAFLRRV